jgi:hypothetical protein
MLLGNIVSICLLDLHTQELGTMMADDFLEVGKGLDIIQQGRIGAGKLQKLNADSALFAAKNDGVKGRFAEGHGGTCCSR